MTNDKIVTSVRIPIGLKKKMHTRLVEQDYGMRGRSAWIEEAILSLLKTDGYEDHVKWDLSNEIKDITITLSLTLTKSTMDSLEKAIVEVRKVFPELEGVKSGIIRAAIIQRILK